MSFFGSSKNEAQPAVQVQVADQEPRTFYLGGSGNSNTTDTSSKLPSLPRQERLAQLFDVGIFRDTLAPSFALHGGLAVVSWGLARATDRVSVKDYMWPAGFALNAWWSAVGRHVIYNNVPLDRTLANISWPERLLLAGVTAWSARLFYRVASRDLRRGADDPRYEIHERKADPSAFWTKAFVGWFLPEALAQTLIALPFTAPFRHQGSGFTGYHPGLQMAAVGLFSAGFALEALADYQLEAHNQAPLEGGLLREGVWSIVRHPNYLGDAMIHASFPLLLYASDILAPVELLALLGPVTNYFYLRYVGGEYELEQRQEQRYAANDPVKAAHLAQYRETKNAFWPAPAELQNPWLWTVAGAGAVGVVVAQILKQVHLS